MPPSSRGIWSRLQGPKSAQSFRLNEKCLISLVLATFVLLCLITMLYLPDKSSSPPGHNMNRVYRVYKDLKDAGRDFILPAPPIGHPDDKQALDLANNKHGVLDKPHLHKIEDKAKLLAQVELDAQIEELRKKQLEDQANKVLPKPSIVADKPKDVDKGKSSSLPKRFGPPDGGDIVITGGEASDKVARDRRDFVKSMMEHAWNGYVKYAWGKNEVRPISLRGHSASVFGSADMGATIVDALDTLYIMGMRDEFESGREWVKEKLSFEMSGDVSVFETNIRYIGGLLSVYAFTGDELFRDKAVLIAEKLEPAFKTPTGIPFALVNPRNNVAKNFGWASGGSSILSEFGTLHMEYAYLSDVTGEPKYRERVERIRKVIVETKRPTKLYPNYLNPKTGRWGMAHTSMGALGDSFYEYLLKEWLRTGKADAESKRMFDSAATDFEAELLKTSPGGLTYFADSKNGRADNVMQHLACFSGGMYALAAHEENDAKSDRWMNLARGITNTCHESYDRADTKLGPEAFRFSEAAEARAMKSNERYYILRPETIESYFIMWRLTHEQKYRDWGWEAAQAIEKHCKAKGGYSGIKNVYVVGGQKDDVQQSFFLAETLKYLYLLFSDDDLISLDHWVFNTEAHPLPIKGHNKFYRAFEPKKIEQKLENMTEEAF